MPTPCSSFPLRHGSCLRAFPAKPSGWISNRRPGAPWTTSSGAFRPTERRLHAPWLPHVPHTDETRAKEGESTRRCARKRWRNGTILNWDPAPPRVKTRVNPREGSASASASRSKGKVLAEREPDVWPCPAQDPQTLEKVWKTGALEAGTEQRFVVEGGHKVQQER